MNASGLTSSADTVKLRKRHSPVATKMLIVLVACVFAPQRAMAGASTDANSDDVTLQHLLDTARDELRVAGRSPKDVQVRLKIIENVATVKAYFPHADGGRPEMRNPEYWSKNDDGDYVPRQKPSESIKDLWRTASGIRCRKLSTLVMLKALIDVSDSKQLVDLDHMLFGKVSPNEIPNDGIGILFEKFGPKHGQAFRNDEFLPGDEIWFDNPYFEQLSKKLQAKYRGQEGHHVFYVGGGNVMDMYGRESIPIEHFRSSFLKWGSVKTATRDQEKEAKAEDFQVKAIRRVIVGGPILVGRPDTE
jgi:hypothetical protein